MPKVNYEKIIRAQRNKVFDIATDYESFQKTLPQYFPSIRIRSNRDNVTVVEEHIRLLGRELVMMTKHVVEYPSVHEVFVIGGDAKGSHVVEKYDEVPEGTKITIVADIKLKGIMKIAGFFGKGKLLKGLMVITDEFAKIAEEKQNDDS